jgi:hypothetical protein
MAQAAAAAAAAAATANAPHHHHHHTTKEDVPVHAIVRHLIYEFLASYHCQLNPEKHNFHKQYAPTPHPPLAGSECFWYTTNAATATISGRKCFRWTLFVFHQT